MYFCSSGSSWPDTLHGMYVRIKITCSTPTTYTTTYALIRALSFFSKLCQLYFCYYPLIKAAEVLHSECKWFSFDKGFVTLNLKDGFQQATPLVSKLKGTLSQHQLILPCTPKTSWGWQIVLKRKAFKLKWGLPSWFRHEKGVVL